MGRIHAASLAQQPMVRLHSFYDRDRSRALILSAQHSATRVAANLDEIFQDVEVHAVYIATQTDSHKELCLAAIKAHKSLMIEKPVALTSSDTLQVLQAAQQTNVRAMVALKFRFYSLVQRAQALMPSPFMVVVQVMDNPWPSDFWANDPLLGGGNVISQGVHGSDLLRFLAKAEPVSCFAVADNYHQTTGVIDNLSATFRFANGAAGALIVGDCGQPPEVGKFFVQMFGAEGTVVLSHRFTRLTFHERLSNAVHTYEGGEDGLTKETEAFMQLLSGSAQQTCTLYDGYMAQVMIDAALASAKKNALENLTYVPQ